MTSSSRSIHCDTSSPSPPLLPLFHIALPPKYVGGVSLYGTPCTTKARAFCVGWRGRLIIERFQACKFVMAVGVPKFPYLKSAVLRPSSTCGSLVSDVLLEREAWQMAVVVWAVSGGVSLRYNVLIIR
jgi:hypothetical protein